MGCEFIARASAVQVRVWAGRGAYAYSCACVQPDKCACMHGWDEGKMGKAVGGTGKGQEQERGHACALMSDMRVR